MANSVQQSLGTDAAVLCLFIYAGLYQFTSAHAQAATNIGLLQRCHRL